jgi:hypothetical protein
MRWALLLAGFLSLLATLVHGAIGYSEAYQPLMAANLDIKAKIMVAVAYHGMTGVLGLASCALIWASRTSGEGWRATGIILGLILFTSGAITAGLGYFWFGDFTTLPNWALMAPAGVLAFFAVI